MTRDIFLVNALNKSDFDNIQDLKKKFETSNRGSFFLFFYWIKDLFFMKDTEETCDFIKLYSVISI